MMNAVKFSARFESAVLLPEMSSKPQLPELKKYMEKRLAVKLNAGRQVGRREFVPGAVKLPSRQSILHSRLLALSVDLITS